MSADALAFWPGSRVTVFDARRFRDDVTTPPSVTMRPATVTAWYGKRSQRYGWTYDSLIDVRFDGDEADSRARFTDFVKPLAGGHIRLPPTVCA